MWPILFCMKIVRLCSNSFWRSENQNFICRDELVSLFNFIVELLWAQPLPSLVQNLSCRNTNVFPRIVCTVFIGKSTYIWRVCVSPKLQYKNFHSGQEQILFTLSYIQYLLFQYLQVSYSHGFSMYCDTFPHQMKNICVSVSLHHCCTVAAQFICTFLKSFVIWQNERWDESNCITFS